MSLYYGATGEDAKYYAKAHCPVCKKEFCMPFRDLWRYKCTNRKPRNGKTVYFDRYSCLMKYERMYPMKRGRYNAEIDASGRYVY